MHATDIALDHMDSHKLAMLLRCQVTACAQDDGDAEPKVSAALSIRFLKDLSNGSDEVNLTARGTCCKSCYSLSSRLLSLPSRQQRASVAPLAVFSC